VESYPGNGLREPSCVIRRLIKACEVSRCECRKDKGEMRMTRDSVFVLFALLTVPALADEPMGRAPEVSIIPVGEENLLGPVAFGDTASFWENHALVVGTVERVRLEYDRAKLLAREHLRIRVKESIPDRHIHKRRSVTKVVERPVVAYDWPDVAPPPRYHVGDELMLITSSAKQEVNSYAMMPGGQGICVVKELNPLLVEETKRLCEALATADPPTRLARIDLILRGRPSHRIQFVLQRWLAASTEELQFSLQETRRLVELAKSMEPRQNPVDPPAVQEESMSGTVTARSGRVVVLQNDEFFSVNKDTEYFQETGLDPVVATAEILTQGTALMAVGNKDIDGEFVARRVYALIGNVLRERQ
jgi:hypothetical protein